MALQCLKILLDDYVVFTEYNTVISFVSQTVENYGQDITVVLRRPKCKVAGRFAFDRPLRRSFSSYLMMSIS